MLFLIRIIIVIIANTCITKSYIFQNRETGTGYKIWLQKGFLGSKKHVL